MGRRGLGSAGFVLLLASGCGGSGVSVVDLDAGAGQPPGGASIVVTQRAAVVAADVDGDGAMDLAALGRDGTGVGVCWRNVGGAFAAAPADWERLPALAALQDDADALADDDLAGALGVRRAWSLARGDVLYALLHLGDGVDGRPLGPPTIHQVLPAGARAGGHLLVRGADLAARGVATTVTVEGAPAQVLYAFPDALVVALPRGLPAGTAHLRVARGEAWSEPVAFPVLPPATPVLLSASPTTLAVGALAVLSGDRLGGPLDVVRVTFSGAGAVPGLGMHDAVVVVVPEGAVGGPVTVTVDGVTSAPLDVEVGDLPHPVLASLSPASASPGSLVALEGLDLLPVEGRLEVAFGAARAAVFAVAPGRVVAIVPAGATDGDVVLTVGGRASNGLPFDVVAREPPSLASIDPETVAPGAFLELRGRDLVDLSAWRPDGPPPRPAFGDLVVSVGGAPAMFVLPHPAGLLVVVPQAATTGTVRVEVGGRASNAVPVTVE